VDLLWICFICCTTSCTTSCTTNLQQLECCTTNPWQLDIHLTYSRRRFATESCANCVTMLRMLLYKSFI